jgi:hypothetical protein
MNRTTPLFGAMTGTFLTLLLLAAPAAMAVDDVSFETVALTGEAAPVTGVPDATFFNFNVPTINNYGNVAFRANIRGTGVPPSNTHAIFKQAPALVLVDRGGPTLGYPVINDLDNVAYIKIGSSEQVWKEDPFLTLVAKKGDPSPDGVLFSRFRGVSINNNGQTAFGAWLTLPASFGSGIYKEAHALETVIKKGDDLPGNPGTFTTVLDIAAEINDNSNTAFYASTNGLTGEGIWTEGSDLTPVVQIGDTASGTGGGAFAAFAFRTAPGFNNAEEVAFLGFLALDPDLGITQANRAGVWKGADELQLVARQQSPAPGTGDQFGSFSDNPAINDSRNQ